MIIQVSSSIVDPIAIIVNNNGSLFVSGAASAISASYAESALSASYAPIVLPDNVVSGSGQVDHDLTIGYSSSRHVDHSSVLMVAGSGMSGGGNILASRTFNLNTSSVHFTDGVKLVQVDAASTASFVSGSAIFKSVREAFTLNPSIGTGTSSFDYTNGSIFYLAGITGNGTWNITNVPTDSGLVHTFTFLFVQGGTPFSASNYQINNTAIAVKWQENNPTGSANKTNTVGLTAFRSGSTWDVLGALSTFG